MVFFLESQHPFQRVEEEVRTKYLSFKLLYKKRKKCIIDFKTINACPLSVPKPKKLIYCSLVVLSPNSYLHEYFFFFFTGLGNPAKNTLFDDYTYSSSVFMEEAMMATQAGPQIYACLCSS